MVSGLVPATCGNAMRCPCMSMLYAKKIELKMESSLWQRQHAQSGHWQHQLSNQKAGPLVPAFAAQELLSHLFLQRTFINEKDEEQFISICYNSLAKIISFEKRVLNARPQTCIFNLGSLAVLSPVSFWEQFKSQGRRRKEMKLKHKTVNIRKLHLRGRILSLLHCVKN